MSRQRWFWSEERQGLVSAEEHYAEQGWVERSHLAAPMVISDHMDNLVNHADGRHYESKSEFRKATKAAGYEEVGNDPSFKNPKHPEYKPEGVKEDIVRAIETSSNK